MCKFLITDTPPTFYTISWMKHMRSVNTMIPKLVIADNEPAEHVSTCAKSSLYVTTGCSIDEMLTKPAVESLNNRFAVLLNLPYIRIGRCTLALYPNQFSIF